jgi:hypothetical protein
VSERETAKELFRWADELRSTADAWYPEDVFPPAPKGQAHKTIEAAAAAMGRHVYKLVAQNLSERGLALLDEAGPEVPPDQP